MKWHDHKETEGNFNIAPLTLKPWGNLGGEIGYYSVKYIFIHTWDKTLFCLFFFGLVSKRNKHF